MESWPSSHKKIEDLETNNSRETPHTYTCELLALRQVTGLYMLLLVTAHEQLVKHAQFGVLVAKFQRPRESISR